MKKTKYIQPQIGMDEMLNDMQLLAVSNKIDENAESVEINPSTMGDGDGSDAASRHSVWEDSDF